MPPPTRVAGTQTVHLSIVIPALDDHGRMEAGLVSVLQHRPPSSEVLVVVTSSYRDPYQLAGEVTFVRATEDGDRARTITQALAKASGEIVHLLAPGVEVTDDWTRSPLRRFADPRVAAVAPWVMHPQQAGQLIAAGVAFSGDHRVVRRNASRLSWPVIGPTALAGFYRCEAVQAVGGFDPSMGSLAEADLALRLLDAGWTTWDDPQSLVMALPAKERGYSAARDNARLWRRHHRTTALTAMAADHAADELESVGWFVLCAERLGRMAALMEWPRPAPQSAPRTPSDNLRGDQRLDSPHAQPSAPAAAKAPSRRSVPIE